MINQESLLNILSQYWPYIFFVFGAVVIALFFYFVIGSFLEMFYDILVERNVDDAEIYGIFLNAFVALGYLVVIKYFGDFILRHYPVNPLAILFLSLAWCLSIVSINEKFTSTERFQMVVMGACLLGFLIWWMWGWLPALYMWALVTFYFYVHAKNK